MNGREAKKLRQLYRRGMKGEIEKQAEQQAELMRERLKKFEEEVGSLLKPPPKWIPEFIWVSLQRIFLNI